MKNIVSRDYPRQHENRVSRAFLVQPVHEALHNWDPGNMRFIGTS